jgi:hypothetical protein
VFGGAQTPILPLKLRHLWIREGRTTWSIGYLSGADVSFPGRRWIGPKISPYPRRRRRPSAIVGTRGPAARETPGTCIRQPALGRERAAHSCFCFMSCWAALWPGLDSEGDRCFHVSAWPKKKSRQSPGIFSTSAPGFSKTDDGLAAWGCCWRRGFLARSIGRPFWARPGCNAPGARSLASQLGRCLS